LQSLRLKLKFKRRDALVEKVKLSDRVCAACTAALACAK